LDLSAATASPVDSRLLSQSFERSAPSLVELVMPMPWFYRRVDKDGKRVRQKRLSSRIIVETYFRQGCCMQPSLPLSSWRDLLGFYGRFGIFVSVSELGISAFSQYICFSGKEISSEAFR
jgi:hypothetical protein